MPAVPFAPDPPPQTDDPAAIIEWAYRQFERLQWAARPEGYPVVYEAPEKPRDGMVRYADGTKWDPGSGEGIYAYYGSTWNKL